jgi:hypothetical protein
MEVSLKVGKPNFNFRSSGAWPWIIALLYFFVCFIWFGRDLNFSGYAHPDERNKINQIIKSDYNFNHPLLMLNSARVVSVMLGKEKSFEDVKIISRFVSVFYASLAVGILVLATGRLYGRFVGISVGLFLMSNPILFELAHYFKEDATVLFGISLTILAMVGYSFRPGLLMIILCGVSAGLAFSGKYAGVIILPFAAYVVLVNSNHKFRDAVFFFTSFAIVFIVVNAPAVLALNQAVGSLDREVIRLTGADQEVKRNIPHGIYTKRYSESSTVVLFLLLIIYFLGIAINGFKLKPVEWAITVFPVFYFLILCFIPVTSNRYFLPCGVLLACLSAIGLVNFSKWRYGMWFSGLLVFISLALSFPKIAKVNRGFSFDHVGELVSYLESEMPANSLLYVAKWIGIPPLNSPNFKYYGFGPEDSIDTLHAQGCTHILLEPVNFRNFLNKTQNRTSFSDADFYKLKVFYESLFNQAVLLRHWKETDNKYLGKEMLLFSLKEHHFINVHPDSVE